MSRRLVLGAGMVGAAGALLSAPARAASPGRVKAVPLHAPAPLARLFVDGVGTLAGISPSGELWQFEPDRWRRLASSLDPSVPLAGGHGRLAGRSREGGLWVSESGRMSLHRTPALAPHAGLLVLAFAVIAVSASPDGQHRVIRLEPGGGGGWTESARSAEPVLPDARPVQFDPAGTSSDDNGHVAVFAGPDRTRYRHGVLGDDLEPTVLLQLERHGLEPMARLALPAPFVFEDIAPRPIAWRGGRALLTVRSGPQGAQMAVVAKANDRGKFELAALGEPIGIAHRWLSPTTDGSQLWAVHTPHVGGVLHRYRANADRLIGEAAAQDVTNHVIGQRELDVSAWAGRSWIVPAQDRRALRVFDIDAKLGAAHRHDVELGQHAIALHRWHRNAEPGVAVLLRDGSVSWVAATR